MRDKAPSIAIRCFLICACFVVFLQFGEAKKKPPERPINLNTASAAQLQEVPGIGPVTAEKILKMRKSYGAFKSVDDLRAIKGIGPKRIEKMRKYLTVKSSPPPKQRDQATTRCQGCPRSPSR
ncbi:MAG TPA: helix-hairpin-helix domain-containing protein [Candidatus Acidoferrum sp.]|nr:helix-hairpin-helix domain-containing protein [Candidatus Acidoferrum sp.]